MNIPNSPLPRIVIIGGGFAGIALAKKLKNKKVQVVLLDKHNYHTFQPLLYQVATGGLEAGSIASMESETYPQGHPMMAQPAMQQGKLLGENLIKLIENKPMEAFEYNDKGSMATIGRNKAVVDLPGYHFSGVFAWFVWMFVHLFSLIGFKNKAVVFLNWVYNYIRFDREGRLIIRPYKKKSFTTFTSDEV
ncbi:MULTISPECIES: FAD-dependent oxidoreductase [unclassified Flavobacterium]|uniref:FAD-dependent oxidoreductase n=1 Tax=unclassified Flavobacterium TaxID=196869 RepID=UPI000F838F4E|nr:MULTISPECIES: FAD-dependent oxidoreductase [unclassified Flavobacterium]RTY65257.1 hypothetical protein EKL95_13075 [Flavobacterium sp. LB2P53]RTY74128.1 hypothetical protein EKL96_08645 [Flavobacterium sp. LS1R10]